MKNKTGFTLVEIMIVVAIIALLSAVGVPAFLNSRENATDQMKIVNVDTINSAKDQWAILNNKSVGTAVSWDDIEDYVGGGTKTLSDLDIDGYSITINSVGTSASY